MTTFRCIHNHLDCSKVPLGHCSRERCPDCGQRTIGGAHKTEAAADACRRAKAGR